MTPPHRAVTLPVPRLPRSTRGFTILELSIVVAIISVVLAFAIPLARQLLLGARIAAVENDLRIFAAAFSAYAQERGDWPPADGSPGVVPSAMAGFLNEASWSKPTPFGGRYAWDPNSRHQGSRHRAVLVLASIPESSVTTDRHQLLALDAEVDDGNLATGQLQLGYRNQPIFILEH